MKKLMSSVFVLAFVLLTIIGCSSSGITSTPFIENETYNPDFPLIGISDRDENGNPSGGYGILGLYEINIDLETLKSEIIPIRKTSLTDVLEIVEITGFLTVFPCSDCVILKSVTIDEDDHVNLTIGIKHPFPAGNPVLPISGINRADLHVFNVEGTIIGRSISTVFLTGMGEIISPLLMVNADGYSPYLDDVHELSYFTLASVHPYKLHFDNYSSGNFSSSNPMGFGSVTDPPPSGNLVMAMGCDYDFQNYTFKILPNESLSFKYAVGCTYAVSAANKASRFNPEYRIPQHLKKAASEVHARIVDNQLAAGDPLSTATIEIDVVDPSQDVPTGTALDRMLHDSSVADIKMEVSGVTLGAVSVPLTNIGGTGHSPTNPLTYSITFENAQSAPAGTFYGLVKVTDSYPPGLNTSDLLQTKDGIKRVEPDQNPLMGIFEIAEFATYQAFEITVAP